MTKSRSQNTKAVIRVVGTFGSFPDTEKSERCGVSSSKVWQSTLVAEGGAKRLPGTKCWESKLTRSEAPRRLDRTRAGETGAH
jgi:hypothetical protein